MQVELKVNDKSVRVEMTEEQLKELGLIEDKPKTGYERVDEDESYFVDDTINDGHEVLGGRTLVNNLYYINGNYYNDKSIVENNAHADRLLRQLRRWQAQNDKVISVSDWKNNQIDKYCIAYSYGDEKLYANNFYYTRLPNVIYFTTQEKAEDAIEQFADELLWYFTEYVQRLDEVQNV